MIALSRLVSVLAATTMAGAALTGAAAPGTAAPGTAAVAEPLWAAAPVPTMGPSPLLVGATARSRTDAWVVGSSGDQWNRRPQALHWDGTRWFPYPVPLGGAPNGVLAAVDAAAPSGDVWAVGSADSQRRTLITRYRAGTWSAVPSPSPGVGAHELRDVSMRSDRDGWAVGSFAESVGGTDLENLSLRWTGRPGRRYRCPTRAPAPTC